MQPDDSIPSGTDLLAIVRPQYCASAQCSDQVVARQKIADHNCFQFAEGRLAAAGEDFPDRPSGAAFHLLIGVDKLHLELRRD